ncbi:hypothetical protein D3C85_1633730 [compost metagenome]
MQGFPKLCDGEAEQFNIDIRMLLFKRFADSRQAVINKVRRRNSQNAQDFPLRFPNGHIGRDESTESGFLHDKTFLEQEIKRFTNRAAAELVIFA